MPVVILPPAFGLRHVKREIYTGDDVVSYWNAYVAITQMHGHGQFSDPRIDVSKNNPPDLVSSKLEALRAYQFSLEKPAPLAGAFDRLPRSADERSSRASGRCSSCHLGDVAHRCEREPAAHGGGGRTGPAYALRSATKLYRTTPLRGLWHPPQLTGPYFHDGSAPTLDAVVDSLPAAARPEPDRSRSGRISWSISRRSELDGSSSSGPVAVTPPARVLDLHKPALHGCVTKGLLSFGGRDHGTHRQDTSQCHGERYVARARGRAAPPARALPARRTRLDRNARRMRHQPVRRVHRPPRRSTGEVVHRARGVGRRQHRHDDRRAPAVTASCTPSRKRSGRSTGFSAASALPE